MKSDNLSQKDQSTRREGENAGEHHAKAKTQDKDQGEDKHSISPRQVKSRHMEIAYQASFGLAAIGAIVISILLYYHKQTWACWTTFATILLVALGFSLLWQDRIWKA